MSLHPELIDYLQTMITPGEKEGIKGVFIYAIPGYDWSGHGDGSVHGIVLESVLDDLPAIKEAHRVLKPGGHLLLAAADNEPTGHTGACFAEDKGFEVRDCILVPDTAGDGDKMHYVAKASRSEREEGLDHLPEQVFGMSGGAQGAIAATEEGEEVETPGGQDIGLNRVQKRRNTHPTVKCVGVMERLLADVPKDVGPVVDPFMGSGTTGIACLRTGHEFIGIEREEEYLTIAEGRIRHWNTRSAGWDAAKVTSDLDTIKKAQEGKPVTLTLDDLFGF